MEMYLVKDLKLATLGKRKKNDLIKKKEIRKKNNEIILFPFS
jgi:hypothetical protein